MIPALLFSLTSAAAAQPPADIEVISHNLRPDMREKVDKAVGGLASLPLYRMEVVVDPDAHTLTGQEQILVSAGAAPLGEVFLRVYENASFFQRDPVISVTDCRVDGKPATLESTTDPSVLHVAFPTPLMPGLTTSVDILFRTELPRINEQADNMDASMMAAMNLMGAGGAPSQSGDHGALGATGTIMNLGYFFPVLAPRKGNFFDTDTPTGLGDLPTADPSNFMVSIVAPSPYRVAGTGIEVGRTPEDAHSTRTTLVAAAVRDFSAFISKEYEEETVTVGGVKVHNYALKRDAAEGKKVLDTAKRALEFYQSRFGTYPWTDFRVAECPLTGAAGGVEYGTIVGVASLLYQPKDSKFASMIPIPGGGASMMEGLLEAAVAHEVAHQWWSAVVGNDTQKHPFVDEPLAQYSSALYVESRRGAKAHDQFMKMQVSGAYQGYRLMGGTDGVVERATKDFINEREYAAMIYCKAPGFYRAVRKALGDKAFNDAVRRYESDHFLGMAGPDDFVAAVAKVAPAKAKTVAGLRDRWLKGVHADEDLGQGDASTLMGNMTGMKIDPQSAQMLKQLEPIIRQMMQQAGTPPPPGVP